MTKSNEYWKNRFIGLEKVLNKYGQNSYRDVEPIFIQAQKEIQDQIDIWYTRLAVNNKISMQDARKPILANELAEFKWDVKQYIKYGEENALNKQWMKQLENASAKYHISRFETLKIRTQQIIEKAFKDEVDELDLMARKVYSEGYYHSCYEIQKGFNIGWDIGQIDNNKLKKLISKPWAADGRNFSDRIWQSKSTMVNELHNELVRTCILGKSPDESIKNMSKFVDKKVKNAKMQAGRLIMTEQAFFASISQKDAFNELGVDEFEIVATLDLQTSEICEQMDGKHFPMRDFEPSVTAPPFHVWCRSNLVPYFNDEWSVGKRVARGENGKIEYVPSNMTYNEWKNSFVDKQGHNWIDNQRKIYKNEENDTKQYEKYKSIFGISTFESLEKFQEIKYNNVDEWKVLKSQKQDRLNKMKFEDMDYLIGTLGNREVRTWYRFKDGTIPNLIDKEKTIERQAMQACDLRNMFRTQARELMADEKERDRLYRDFPNLTFEELISRKIQEKSLNREQAIKDVLNTATKTNPKVNKKFGLE